ncbi:unnamed protein product [Rotaria socialis]|uniref:Uncharacterized protein n=1 Tax=Rotaria socialis TaxID=392032 RepID=A0A817Y838_9BILA|nr:unnamed protein product [Rotaria socialis]
MLPIIIQTYRLTDYYSRLTANQTESFVLIANAILPTIDIVLVTYMIFQITPDCSLNFSSFFCLFERNEEEQKKTTLKKEIKETQLYVITKQTEKSEDIDETVLSQEKERKSRGMHTSSSSINKNSKQKRKTQTKSHQ